VLKSLCAKALLAFSLVMPSIAVAATDAELTEIREQIKQIKESYEARIRALEDRLKAAETAASLAPATASAPAVAGPSGPYAASMLAAFNPGISVVLQGSYASLSQDPTQFAISGFRIGEEVGPGRRGLGLSESEISFLANVDDKFYGNLTIALTPENEVEVEEAYGVLTALPYGIVPKFGRFFSGIGYMNEQHQHVWDFKDAPLAYQAFLGTQFAQDGVQLRWVAPTDAFLELGAEIGNGDSFPGSQRNSNGIGAGSVFVHAGGDVGPRVSWRAGVSFLRTHASDRQAAQLNTTRNIVQTAFAGTTKLAVADFVWKFAPTGNAKEGNVKVQGEYFRARERGDLTYDSDGSLGLTQTDAYASQQQGWYLQGVWQFLPMWRVGLRYDRLDPGSPDYGANAGFLATAPFDPRKTTAMLDYTPSEFSRFRLQYAQSKTRPDMTDNQLFLQYILTLGAHPAHKF